MNYETIKLKLVLFFSFKKRDYLLDLTVMYLNRLQTSSWMSSIRIMVSIDVLSALI